MENQKQTNSDPASLTHYLGNDDYKEGNKILPGVLEDTDEFDGFSAEGNDLEEENSEDADSDLPEDL